MAKEKTNETAPTQAVGFTYVLAFPITYEGEEIKDIAYRRPKGRDGMRAFKARNEGGDLYLSLLVNITEYPESFFQEIDLTDYAALVDLCDGFLEPPKKSKAA